MDLLHLLPPEGLPPNSYGLRSHHVDLNPWYQRHGSPSRHVTELLHGPASVGAFGPPHPPTEWILRKTHGVDLPPSWGELWTCHVVQLLSTSSANNVCRRVTAWLTHYPMPHVLHAGASHTQEHNSIVVGVARQSSTIQLLITFPIV
jgi:hypothetical protein